MHFPLEQSKDVKEILEYVPSGGRGGECLSVYYPRLLRDGWTLTTKLSEVRLDSCDAFEKPLAGGWTLRKLAHAQIGQGQGKSVYWDEHEVENAKLGALFQHPKWEWAERDGDSVVWAEGGCLYRAAVAAKGLGAPQLLLDTNPMTFEKIQAPY